MIINRIQTLLRACAEGRPEDVTALLSQEIDVNTRDPKVRLLSTAAAVNLQASLNYNQALPSSYIGV